MIVERDGFDCDTDEINAVAEAIYEMLHAHLRNGYEAETALVMAHARIYLDAGNTDIDTLLGDYNRCFRMAVQLGQPQRTDA